MSISSLVLRTHPERADDLEKRVTALPGTEVHKITPDGQLVVTIDNPDDGEAANVMQQLQDLEGVLSASLIYVRYDNDNHEDQPS